MFIEPFTSHYTIFIFTVKFYIYIIPSTLYTLLQPKITFACPSRPPPIPLDASNSIHPTPPPLRLQRAVRPQERVALTLRRLSLRTWTNLVHQNHSSYFIYINVLPQMSTTPPTLLISRPLPTFTMNVHPYEVFNAVIYKSCESTPFILASLSLYPEEVRFQMEDSPSRTLNTLLPINSSSLLQLTLISLIMLMIQ